MPSEFLLKINREGEESDNILKNLESFSSFYEKNLPEQKWIVKDLIPACGISIISAPPGHYKTWLLLDMAIAIAKGKKVFNHFEVEQGSILIINEENHEKIIQDRIKKLTNKQDLPIFFLNNQEFQLEDDKIKLIIKICKDKNIKLVIFDSLIRIHRFKENDSGESNQLYLQLKKLQKEKLTILLTHHHRKNGISKSRDLAGALRGSGDIEAFLDVHIAVEKATEGEEGFLMLTQVKQRIAPPIKPFRVDYRIDENKAEFAYVSGYELKIVQKKSKAKKYISDVLGIIKENPGITKTELYKKFSGKAGQTIIKNILLKLEKDKKIHSPSKGTKKYYPTKDTLI